MPKPKQIGEDLLEYNFAKYAATYFIGHVSHQYSKRPLKSSLLEHILPLDNICAKSIWITILRFMGDLAEAKYDIDDDDDNENGSSKAPVMQRITLSLSKGFVKSKEFQEAVLSLEETDHERLIRKTLKRKTKLPEILRKTFDNSEELEYYEQWLGARSTNLDKLHFIIGHGIIRTELRDEIFCQICKQLTNNPHQTSYAKGWILLSLCIGCFPPSERFQKYLRNFIRHGPSLYSIYCENRLDRTLQNGARTQPPSWLELHATRHKTPIVLNIILMDGNVKKLQVDSASTAKEAVEQIAKAIGLKDFIGFSIIITLLDKIMSLGSGREHIMDAVSNCEQYAKEQGINDRKAPWKLYYRKEFFTPWYDPSEDQIATDLIYRQIVRGISFGEYRCKTDKDIAVIAALHFFIENGHQMDRKLLRQVLPDYIPKDLLASGEKTLDKWEKLVADTFERNDYVRNQEPKLRAKEDISIFAQINWPMMFSRFFEAVRISGPKLPSDNIIFAINWTGIFLIDETEQILVEFSFPEITSITYQEDEDSNIDEFIVNTIQKEDFVFKCYDSKDVSEMVNYILNNLKSRSVYAIAMENFENSGDTSNYLRLLKGDLITFEKGITGAVVLQSETRWARGECNGITGEFPTNGIYVLPCIKKPTKQILQLFKNGVLKSKNYAASKYSTLQRKKMHTLRKFASEHFRKNVVPPRLSYAIHSAKNQPDDLWRHSRDPIKAPLLQKLQTEKDLFDHAVIIFSYILRYMGDMPSGRSSINTDRIFKPAIQDERLRDELFCQIMKQLTDNHVQLSEERGWDLMWLATGVMYPPNSLLLKELMEFLRTRTHPIAVESLKRVKKTLKFGERKHPPYIIEVEAIQKRVMQIYHKIYFPDDNVEAFEIESSTRSKDLCSAIMKRLDLKSIDGFSLFIKILDKAFSIPEDDFIFDFINELVDWMKETMPTRSADQQINCQYQLFFMKKLWINIVPGKDRNADIIFYFSQEVPKYLNGYYKVSKNEAFQFAGILYRIQFQTDMLPLQRVQEILSNLVPDDMIKLQKPDEWRKHIMLALNSLNLNDRDDLKEEFLKEISKYETFGSTFFVVTQTNDSNLPDTILIAINRNGFNIIDPRSKEILQTYEFSQLNFWSSGNTYFHIRFGNMIGASKLLCTTTQGYKIDNLLTSYIKHLK